MKTLIIASLAIVALTVQVSFADCGVCSASAAPKPESQAVVAAPPAAENIELCVKCGQIKGTDQCCKPGQTACKGCGLVKGSPGCCKIPKDAKEAIICQKCGQIKGTDKCCKPDQAVCKKCGLVKGSPGCCRLGKAASGKNSPAKKASTCLGSK